MTALTIWCSVCWQVKAKRGLVSSVARSDVAIYLWSDVMRWEDERRSGVGHVGKLEKKFVLVVILT